MLCKTCSSDKDACDFYASSKSRCKDCTKAAVAANRAKNLDKIRAYDRMRGSMPHRVAARAAYQKTPRFAERHEAASKRWAARHPERRAAQIAVRNAVRDGRLTPWPICALPDCSTAKPEAHHPDYSRPLDVVWLCTKHHKQVHAYVAANSPYLEQAA